MRFLPNAGTCRYAEFRREASAEMKVQGELLKDEIGER